MRACSGLQWEQTNILTYSWSNLPFWRGKLYLSPKHIYFFLWRNSVSVVAMGLHRWPKKILFISPFSSHAWEQSAFLWLKIESHKNISKILLLFISLAFFIPSSEISSRKCRKNVEYTTEKQWKWVIFHCFSYCFPTKSERSLELVTEATVWASLTAIHLMQALNWWLVVVFFLITFVFKNDFRRIVTVWKSTFQAVKRKIFSNYDFIRELSGFITESEPDEIQINYSEAFN